jgi:hypothetical protein
MNVFAKILTLFGMLATVAWFFWNPVGWVFQWEPIVVFLLALAGFVAAEKTTPSALAEKQNLNAHPNDVRLFKEFLGIMPSKTFIEFLKQHDFLLEFELENLNPLRRFINEWDNAEHEFQDAELEDIRKSLMSAGEYFSRKVSKYTSPNDSGWQAVRSDRLKGIEEHEKRFRNEAAIIDAASDEFVRLHQELVRKGRLRCQL